MLIHLTYRNIKQKQKEILNMKRILALILAGVMVFALVACTGTKVEVEDDTTIDVEAPNTDAEPSDTPDPTPEVKDEVETPVEDKKPETTPEVKPSEDKKPAEKPTEDKKPEVKPEQIPVVKPEEKPAEPEIKDEPKPEEKPAETPAGATMGDTMLAVFRANRDRSIDDIANACISDKSIQFFGMTAPMEEGFFPEFDGDVKGFTKCVKFGPAMGSIAFSGLVFEVSGDANAFADDLKSRANPRWNICVEAEQTICEVYGNKVFFLMCPKSLGE